MVYVYLAEGFEEIEALTTVDVLRRAEVEVKTVSVTGWHIVTGSRGIPVKADLLFKEADHDSCEMMVLPGGMPGAVNLRDHQQLCQALKTACQQGRKVAAICAAPLVLAHCGILEGVPATIYPGMEDQLGGAEYTAEDVTVSGNVITGRGPGLAMAFALTLVEELKGSQVRDQVAKGLLFTN